MKKNPPQKLPSSIFAPRRDARAVSVGKVQVGGDAPISVQSMTKTDTHDVRATSAQVRRLAAAGCDIVRIAVPDRDAALALARIIEKSRVPIVADIHFDHRLALMALEAGVSGLRLNPGNIGAAWKIKEVARAASERDAPIRVGVNAGSLEKDILAKRGGASAKAMAESALRHAALLEKTGFRDIKLSVKASDVERTVRAYEILAARTDYPLHLGLTEAGATLEGAVRSSAALGALLARGIGDTIRVSLTDDPVVEVRVGIELLACLGLRAYAGPRIISCPACGRARIDVAAMARRVQRAVEKMRRDAPNAGPWPVMAVMGCEVNGPGEAREADVALAGGRGKAAVFIGGRHVRTVPEARAADELIRAAREWMRAHREQGAAQ